MREDVWTETVRTYLFGKPEVTVPTILRDAIDIPLERQSRKAEMRVADILRADKWRRDLQRRNGKPTRIWLRPSDDNTDGEP